MTPLATEALRRIAMLYAVEELVLGQSSAHRLAVRRARSKPIVDALQSWLEATLPSLPPRGKLAEAMLYALTRWDGLTRFLDDGRIELDTNPVERAIRPVALGRKNHLFAGSDGGAERWAVIGSLIETAKLTGSSPTHGSRTCSPACSPDTQPAASTNCCRGAGKRRIPPTPDGCETTGRLRYW